MILSQLVQMNWKALKYISIKSFTLIYEHTLRVPLKAELDGLDISEHGMEAYNGFVQESDMIGSSISSNDS